MSNGIKWRETARIEYTIKVGNACISDTFVIPSVGMDDEAWNRVRETLRSETERQIETYGRGEIDE